MAAKIGDPASCVLAIAPRMLDLIENAGSFLGLAAVVLRPEEAGGVLDEIEHRRRQHTPRRVADLAAMAYRLGDESFKGG